MVDTGLRRMCVPFLAATLAAGLAGCVPSPDGPPDTFGLDLSLDGATDADGAIVFIVDGVHADIFKEMLEAGELPAIDKYFVRRGLYAPRVVANVPSVTLANLTSITTGKFPGHHGVTGINWFDRNQLIWRDYATIAQKNTLDCDYTAKTIYEHFPERTTVSVFFQPHRGTTKFIENWTSAGPPYFFGWYEFVDRLTLSRFSLVAEIARQRAEWPAVTAVYLLAPDFAAYGHGASSAEYRDALRHTDRQIGRVLGDVERAGLLDNLHIAFVSDHGMVDVDEHFVLEDFLRDEVGLDVARKHLWEETPFEKRLDYYDRYSCVYYGSGDRYAAICLRKPIREAKGYVTGYEPWPVRPGPEDLANYPFGGGVGVLPFSAAYHKNLLDVLVSRPEVHAVAWRQREDAVRLRTKAGEVEFRRPAGPGGGIAYRVVDGADPLGWAGAVPETALAGEPMGSRAWLEATIDTEYPDLPAQLLAYFRARRAGDIVAFAAEGWDFSNVHSGGHGGLSPGDMHVPMLIAGPDVPVGEVKAARAVDLVPTILSLLGRPVPEDLDGRPLAPAPRNE